MVNGVVFCLDKRRQLILMFSASSELLYACIYNIECTFRSLILVATSGDTGGAVINAFTRHTGM